MGALGGVLGTLLVLALLALAILVHKHYGARLRCCGRKALVSRTGRDSGALGARSGPGPGSPLMPRLPPAPQESQPYGFDNKAFLSDNHEPSWSPAPSPGPGPDQGPGPDPGPDQGPGPDPGPSGAPAEVPPAPAVPSPPPSPPPAPPAPRSPRPGQAPGQAPEASAGVRSILTKERRPEGGYKAVWFGGSDGADADVVVLNAPVLDADGAGDSGGDFGGDSGSDSGGEGSGDEGADAAPGWGPRADAPGIDSTYI